MSRAATLSYGTYQLIDLAVIRADEAASSIAGWNAPWTTSSEPRSSHQGVASQLSSIRCTKAFASG